MKKNVRHLHAFCGFLIVGTRGDWCVMPMDSNKILGRFDLKKDAEKFARKLSKV